MSIKEISYVIFKDEIYIRKYNSVNDEITDLYNGSLENIPRNLLNKNIKWITALNKYTLEIVIY